MAIKTKLVISATAGARANTATIKTCSMSAPNSWKMLPLFYWLARFSWSCWDSLPSFRSNLTRRLGLTAALSHSSLWLRGTLPANQDHVVAVPKTAQAFSLGSTGEQAYHAGCSIACWCIKGIAQAPHRTLQERVAHVRRLRQQDQIPGCNSTLAACCTSQAAGAKVSWLSDIFSGSSEPDGSLPPELSLCNKNSVSCYSMSNMIQKGLVTILFSCDVVQRGRCHSCHGGSGRQDCTYSLGLCLSMYTYCI
jgi:hypothetical protein